MSPPSRAIRYAHPTAEVTAPPYDVLTPELRDELPRARPAQRRPPDPERLGGRGGPAVPGLARGGRARPRRRAGRVGGRAGVRRPGRRRATPRGPRRLAAGRAVRDAGRCSRTSARTRGRRRAVCGCFGRRGRSSSRSSSSTTASRPSPCPIASPTSSTEGHEALAAPGRRRRRGVRRPAAADRRRPPPLRDGRRVRGRGGDARERADDGRARLDLRPRPRDLPHPPALPRPRARRCRPSASATRRLPRRPSTRLAGLPYDRAHAVGYRRGVTFPVVGEPGELDVELVDRLVGHEGLGYTADLDEAVARVDSGEFDGAFLLRATRIEDVFERARRGEVMPQKTTYFFPKLTSGLLFHPV